MSRAVIVALVAVALIVACTTSAPPRPPLAPRPAPTTDASSAAAPEPTPATSSATDQELDALMRETMDYFGKVSVAVAAAGTDCPAMADAIERVVGEHGTLIERALTLDDPSMEDRSQNWLEAHADEVKPTFEKLFKGIEPCGDHADVQHAVEKMSGA